MHIIQVWPSFYENRMKVVFSRKNQFCDGARWSQVIKNASLTRGKYCLTSFITKTVFFLQLDRKLEWGEGGDYGLYTGSWISHSRQDCLLSVT